MLFFIVIFFYLFEHIIVISINHLKDIFWGH